MKIVLYFKVKFRMGNRIYLFLLYFFMMILPIYSQDRFSLKKFKPKSVNCEPKNFKNCKSSLLGGNFDLENEIEKLGFNEMVYIKSVSRVETIYYSYNFIPFGEFCIMIEYCDIEKD
ncbi:hypothetical protein [Leptospira sp. GIMC2001]|uniref:hypothetical protein n=1 Tax=Leptospira sp. GIMC2001 TaxID=1513297 RepID=UPI00234A6A1A|nr:hypothetical protein [Leptospira sp. GIMC2001]WCL48103.1 hypothetical protein O4O04_12345 [Leptospira sp. GIMC2001]